MSSKGLKGGATALAGLVVAATLAAPADAAPWSGLIHGQRGRKAAREEIPSEGVWRLAPGAVQKIFLHQGKKAVPVVVYVCVDFKSGGPRPVVRVQMPGRPAVEASAGCENVYLEVDSGDWISLVNPGPDGASGSYKVSRQG